MSELTLSKSVHVDRRFDAEIPHREEQADTESGMTSLAPLPSAYGLAGTKNLTIQAESAQVGVLTRVQRTLREQVPGRRAAMEAAQRALRSTELSEVARFALERVGREGPHVPPLSLLNLSSRDPAVMIPDVNTVIHSARNEQKQTLEIFYLEQSPLYGWGGLPKVIARYISLPLEGPLHKMHWYTADNGAVRAPDLRYGPVLARLVRDGHGEVQNLASTIWEQSRAAWKAAVAADKGDLDTIKDDPQRGWLDKYIGFGISILRELRHVVVSLGCVTHVSDARTVAAAVFIHRESATTADGGQCSAQPAAKDLESPAMFEASVLRRTTEVLEPLLEQSKLMRFVVDAGQVSVGVMRNPQEFYDVSAVLQPNTYFDMPGNAPLGRATWYDVENPRHLHLPFPLSEYARLVQSEPPEIGRGAFLVRESVLYSRDAQSVMTHELMHNLASIVSEAVPELNSNDTEIEENEDYIWPHLLHRFRQNSATAPSIYGLAASNELFAEVMTAYVLGDRVCEEDGWSVRGHRDLEATVEGRVLLRQIPIFEKRLLEEVWPELDREESTPERRAELYRYALEPFLKESFEAELGRVRREEAGIHQP